MLKEPTHNPLNGPALSEEVYRLALDRIKALLGCTEDASQERIDWATIADAYEHSVHSNDKVLAAAALAPAAQHPVQEAHEEHGRERMGATEPREAATRMKTTSRMTDASDLMPASVRFYGARFSYRISRERAVQARSSQGPVVRGPLTIRPQGWHSTERPGRAIYMKLSTVDALTDFEQCLSDALKNAQRDRLKFEARLATSLTAEECIEREHESHADNLAEEVAELARKFADEAAKVAKSERAG